MLILYIYILLSQLAVITSICFTVQPTTHFMHLYASTTLNIMHTKSTLMLLLFLFALIYLRMPLSN